MENVLDERLIVMLLGIQPKKEMIEKNYFSDTPSMADCLCSGGCKGGCKNTLKGARKPKPKC